MPKSGCKDTEHQFAMSYRVHARQALANVFAYLPFISATRITQASPPYGLPFSGCTALACLDQHWPHCLPSRRRPSSGQHHRAPFSLAARQGRDGACPRTCPSAHFASAESSGMCRASAPAGMVGTWPCPFPTRAAGPWFRLRALSVAPQVVDDVARIRSAAEIGVVTPVLLTSTSYCSLA